MPALGNFALASSSRQPGDGLPLQAGSSGHFLAGHILAGYTEQTNPVNTTGSTNIYVYHCDANGNYIDRHLVQAIGPHTNAAQGGVSRLLYNPHRNRIEVVITSRALLSAFPLISDPACSDMIVELDMAGSLHPSVWEFVTPTNQFGDTQINPPNLFAFKDGYMVVDGMYNTAPIGPNWPAGSGALLDNNMNQLSTFTNLLAFGSTEPGQIILGWWPNYGQNALLCWGNFPGGPVNINCLFVYDFVTTVASLVWAPVFQTDPTTGDHYVQIIGGEDAYFRTVIIDGDFVHVFLRPQTDGTGPGITTATAVANTGWLKVDLHGTATFTPFSAGQIYNNFVSLGHFPFVLDFALTNDKSAVWYAGFIQNNATGHATDGTTQQEEARLYKLTFGSGGVGDTTGATTFKDVVSPLPLMFGAPPNAFPNGAYAYLGAPYVLPNLSAPGLARYPARNAAAQWGPTLPS